MLCSISLISYGQLKIDSLYENKNEFLIYSKIVKFDSLSIAELNKRIKNWAGLKFVNMKDVLVSETTDQLVFNYITSSFFGYYKVPFKSQKQITKIDWYIRMVIQMKDNRIRILFFDDGNAFMQGSEGFPSTPSRQFKLANYFKKDGTCHENYNDGMINLKNELINTVNDLFNSIILGGVKKGDDW